MASNAIQALLLTPWHSVLKTTTVLLLCTTKWPVPLDGGLLLDSGPAFLTILMRPTGPISSATITPSLLSRTTKWVRTITSPVPWALTISQETTSAKKYPKIKNLTQLQATSLIVQLDSTPLKERAPVAPPPLASISPEALSPLVLPILTAIQAPLLAPPVQLVLTLQEPTTLVYPALLATPALTQANSPSALSVSTVAITKTPALPAPKVSCATLAPLSQDLCSTAVREATTVIVSPALLLFQPVLLALME